MQPVEELFLLVVDKVVDLVLFGAPPIHEPAFLFILNADTGYQGLSKHVIQYLADDVYFQPGCACYLLVGDILGVQESTGHLDVLFAPDQTSYLDKRVLVFHRAH